MTESKQKSSTPPSTSTSSLPLDLHTLQPSRERRRFYGWLNNIKKIEELMQPGMVDWWHKISYNMRCKILTYVRKELNEGDVSKFATWRKQQKPIHRLRTTILKKVDDPEYALAVTEKLTSTADVLTVVPKKQFADSILLLASRGVPPDLIADYCQTTPEVVEKIATPLALREFQGSAAEMSIINAAMEEIAVKILVLLRTSVLDAKDLSVLMNTLIQRRKLELDEIKGGKRIPPEDIIDVVETIEDRHKELLK